nr:MAG TPA: hypothetical protein [Caudoviricetes sp.]
MARTENNILREEKVKGLEGARATPRHILEHQKFITIEDVLKQKPLPKFLHHNTIGGVFRTLDFECVGWGRSTRLEMNGRYIRRWKLRDK